MLFVGDIDDGVCGPALTITLEWSEPDSNLQLLIVKPTGQPVGFGDLMGVSAHLNCARWRPVHLL